MIFKAVKFKFGENGSQNKKYGYRLKRINIFVGPNNSGKTLTLKEIGSFFEKRRLENSVLFGETLKATGDKKTFYSIDKLYLFKNETVFEQIKEFFEKEFIKKVSIPGNSFLLAEAYRDIFDMEDLKEEDFEKLITNKIISKSIFKRYNSKDEISEKKDNSKNSNDINEFLLRINSLFSMHRQGKVSTKEIWDEKYLLPYGFVSIVPTEYIRTVSNRAGHKKEKYFHFVSLIPNDMVSEFSEVRNLILDNFGIILGLDFHYMGIYPKEVVYRICENTDYINQELSLSQESLEYFSSQRDLESCSDGIKSLIELLFKLYSSTAKVFLLDEPDLFLHPPYAKKLGTLINAHSIQKNSQFFIATHNQNLLAGILEAQDSDLNVFRFTYIKNKPSIKKLENKVLKQIIKDPNLRFSGILESIFSEGVILVEGPGDRNAYYLALDFYLSRHPKERIDGLSFVFSGGKPKVPEMAEKLGKLGIPYVIIFDADVLSGENLINLFNKINSSNKGILSSIKDDFTNEYKKRLKPGEKLGELFKIVGLKSLTEEEREKYTILETVLSSNGVFIVEEGFLEKTVSEIYSQVEKESDMKNQWQEKFSEIMLAGEKEEEIKKWPIISLIAKVNMKLRERLGLKSF